MPDAKQPTIIAYLKPQCGWSRGVRAILQKYNLQYEDRDVISVPDPYEPFSPMVVAVPLQLLAYHIAVLRGADVDQPRNLAKSVTVE